MKKFIQLSTCTLVSGRPIKQLRLRRSNTAVTLTDSQTHSECPSCFAKLTLEHHERVGDSVSSRRLTATLASRLVGSTCCKPRLPTDRWPALPLPRSCLTLVAIVISQSFSATDVAGGSARALDLVHPPLC